MIENEYTNMSQFTNTSLEPIDPLTVIDRTYTIGNDGSITHLKEVRYPKDVFLNKLHSELQSTDSLTLKAFETAERAVESEKNYELQKQMVEQEYLLRQQQMQFGFQQYMMRMMGMMSLMSNRILALQDTVSNQQLMIESPHNINESHNQIPNSYCNEEDIENAEYQIIEDSNLNSSIYNTNVHIDQLEFDDLDDLM